MLCLRKVLKSLLFKVEIEVQVQTVRMVHTIAESQQTQTKVKLSSHNDVGKSADRFWSDQRSLRFEDPKSLALQMKL